MGVIAIVNPGGVGDILLSTGILKYKDELWPGKDVVWYCCDNNRHALAGVRGLKEIRRMEFTPSHYQWKGSDVDKMCIPCPWMGSLPCAHKELPNGTLMADKHRLLFEQDTSARIPGSWHACLECSPQDDSMASSMMECLPRRKTIMLETGYLSSQSFLDQGILLRMVDVIKTAWGECNFLFVSGNLPLFPKDGEGKWAFDCSKLPISAVLAMYNRIDAFVGVSSGISCAVCSWNANPAVPRLEMTIPEASCRKVSRGPISTALDEKQLFSKLPAFLEGKYDFVPSAADGLPVLFERKVYSQNGEDGLLESLFKRIGTTNKVFVEIGVGDGTENNTRKLAGEGWKGRWLSMPPVKCVPEEVELVEAKVTAENVNGLLEGLPNEIDLLSIDIDGNDYWVWKAIERVSARAVIIEYNAMLQPPASVAIKYDPDFSWAFTDYMGASLCALDKLGKDKGYSLICCDSNGVNAVFAKGFSSSSDPQDVYAPFSGYDENFHLGHDTREWEQA